MPGAGSPTAEHSGLRLRYAKQALADRRARNRFFDGRMFGEAPWDILLDLYVADHQQTQVSVSSLCIAAAVPETTALRYIKSLTADGMIESQPDPQDARRSFVSLTPDAKSKMDALIDHCLRSAAR